MTQAQPATSHWDIKVRDLSEARQFYAAHLGFVEGPALEESNQFHLGENTIVCHLDTRLGHHGKVARQYDFAAGQTKPVPHCTVVVTRKDLASITALLIRRRLKYASEGETRSVIDPFGNVIEFSSRSHAADHSPRGWLRKIIFVIGGVGVVCLLAWLVLR